MLLRDQSENLCRVPNKWKPVFTGEPGSMVVTWTTFSKAESKVEYGLLGGRLFDMTVGGKYTLFVDSGDEKRKMFIHRVTLTDLKPAAVYGESTFDATDSSCVAVEISKCTSVLFQSTTVAVMMVGVTSSPSLL